MSLKTIVIIILCLCLGVVAGSYIIDALQSAPALTSIRSRTAQGTSFSVGSSLVPSDEALWNTYTNRDFGYQMEIPKDWAMGEYTLSETNNTIADVAFDPEGVVSEETFRSLDLAPGMVWVSVSDYFPGTGEVVDLNSELSARYLVDRCEQECPNPWWEGKVDERYFLTVPQGSSQRGTLMLEFNYPIQDEGNEGLQLQLEHIRESFRFSSF